VESRPHLIDSVASEFLIEWLKLQQGFLCLLNNDLIFSLKFQWSRKLRKIILVLEIMCSHPGKNRNNDLFQIWQRHLPLGFLMQLKHLGLLLT